jgi:hypothetical protein
MEKVYDVVMRANQNRQDHEQEKSRPDLAQEKLEQDRFVRQAALRVGIFVARLQSHAQISDLALSPRSSTRFTRATCVSLGRRHVAARPTSPHASRNRAQVKPKFLRSRRRAWRHSAGSKCSDSRARPPRA